MENTELENAKKIINASVVIRLLGNAAMAGMLAYSFSSMVILHRAVFHADNDLLIAIIGLLLDTLLTILWLRRKIFHTVHLILYILGGVIYYYYYMSALTQGINIAAVFFVVISIPVMWVVGLIAFIICGIGRKKRTEAQKALKIADGG